MSDNWEKPRINSLALRRVTRYMTALAKEWETYGLPDLPALAPAPRAEPRIPARDASAPAIPDPWDDVGGEGKGGAPEFSIPRSLPQGELSEPDGVTLSGPGASPDPWSREPATAGRAHPQEGVADEEPVWMREELSEEALASTWEIPDLLPDLEAEEEEGSSFRVQTFATPKERDDFHRAMMYLSQDDDFLVTGVGKRVPDEAEQAESAPRGEERIPPRSGPPAPLRDMPQEADGEEEERRPFPVMRLILVAALVLLLAGAGFAAWYFFFSGQGTGPSQGAVNAAVVFVGDENIGCVADGAAIQLAMEMAREEVELEAMLPAVFDREVRLEPMRVDARYLAPQLDMERAVLDVCNVLVKACGVYVDGRLVCVARSSADVEAVMQEGLMPYQQIAQGNRDIRDLRFSQTVEARAITAAPENVLTRDELYGFLISGEKDAREDYEVVSGDSLIGIAGKNDMTLGEIRYANPQLIGRDLIQIGSTLSLDPPDGLLTVQFTERVTEEIKSPFATVTETSNKLYTTQSEEKVKGVDGLRSVVADKTYVAGVQVGETILEETLITEAVDRVVVKGTKKVESASGSTVYLWPTQGTISSKFGERWGKTHQGLDIAAPTGTPIYAARDGKVSFSGTNGNYGKMIKIDHGEGIETRYAHCSVLKVSQGTSVKKGQLIALVGSTGNSTGPHLHFEIRVDGVAKNPQHYLPK